ncbi:MAG: nuclear transport factor 2 family protein [Stellaceae bacterium]
MTAPEMIMIEDRLAIEDLFVRYTTALDNGEVETVVGCFTADAVLESPAIGQITGHDAIRAFAGRFAALRRDGTQFRHMVTNLAAEITGERARATCYLLVQITRDSASRALPPGRYECDLVKEDGQWRFRRRIVLHDHAYTLDGLAP